jgi:hypothetical protein
MSLFEEASLVITPNAFKAGKLYAVKGADLNVTRATSATRVNANGLIETVASNVPRIDHTGGGCPSILVEGQRTNLLLNSETVATQTINVTAVAHTISFYGSGTITLSGVHSATIEGTGTACRTLTFTPTAGNLIITVSGTCTKGQLEAGSYATSYIPTTTASVTRNADLISKTGIGSIFGINKGTIFIDFKAPSFDSLNNQYIFDLSDDSSATSNRFALYKTASNFYQLFTNTSTNFTINYNTRNKFAITWNGSTVKIYANGALKSTITYTNANPTKINLGSRFNNVEIGNVNYNLVAAFSTDLTNDECIVLTTI